MKLFSFHNGERRVFSDSSQKSLRRAIDHSLANPKLTVVVVAHTVDPELVLPEDMAIAALNGEIFSEEAPYRVFKNGEDFFSKKAA